MFECRHILIAVLHAVDGTRDAPGFQSGLDERGINGIILQVQDAEREMSFANLLLSSLGWKSKRSRRRPPRLRPRCGRRGGE